MAPQVVQLVAREGPIRLLLVKYSAPEHSGTPSMAPAWHPLTSIPLCGLRQVTCLI